VKSGEFIPTTLEREIAPDIVFRPIKSWHSGTFAGERLTKIPGTTDGSGCLRDGRCSPPLTVTHRKYWNKKTNKSISAFLSYPNGMSRIDRYFWEIYPIDGDIERFNSEEEMEEKIKELLK
jgi:hypothetical protein